MYAYSNIEMCMFVVLSYTFHNTPSQTNWFKSKPNGKKIIKNKKRREQKYFHIFVFVFNIWLFISVYLPHDRSFSDTWLGAKMKPKPKCMWNAMWERKVFFSSSFRCGWMFPRFSYKFRIYKYWFTDIQRLIRCFDCDKLTDKV